MGKEIKKETSWSGEEKWVIYEDGVKVGETKKETGWTGKEKQVTRNASGEKVSETKRDGDKFVTRDADGQKISETKYEGSQEVIYEKGQKIGELKREDTFFGAERKKLHESSGYDVDLTKRASRTSAGHGAHETNYRSGGGYSGTSSTWADTTKAHKGIPDWVKWFLGLVVLGITIGLVSQFWPSTKLTTTPKNTVPVYLPVTQEMPQGKIIFVAYSDGIPQIYSINPDGTNQVRLTNHQGGAGYPAPSPDGKKIAFASYPDRYAIGEIYIMGRNGENVERLPIQKYNGSNPAWVSNSRIIFIHKPSSYMSWVFLKGIGSLEKIPETLLFPNQYKYNERDRNFEEYAYLAVSPDGNKIAFTKNIYNVPLVTGFLVASHITISDIGGSKEVSLTDFGGDLSPQAWSPSGDKIVFSVNSKIGIIEPEGSKFLWFTSYKVTWLNVSGKRPSWSPDGNWIVFDNKEGIYILEVASGGIKKLTEDRFLNQGPTWIQ